MIKKMVIHESEGFVAPDICGTAIELINAENSIATKISFAKIIIEPGQKSRCHYHKVTEEIYYIVAGTGKVIINNEAYDVLPGHAVFLPIEAKHQIINTGNEKLIFLCSDAPIFDSNDVFEIF